MSERDLERRIEDLEFRLHRYHEHLHQAVDERDRLALDAAWGVHQVVTALLAVGLTLFALHTSVGFDSWWKGVLAGALSLAVYFLAFSWSNGARMKEAKRLAKLPEWEWKQD